MDRSLKKELKLWKDSHLRHPLLLRGARQVGKTYLIEKFAEEEFPSFASVNFEAQPEASACFESLNPTEILRRLEIVLKQPIIPGKTLLFLDEIQACPQAIVAMRYFKEKLPSLHVIGAGSLLEFALVEGKFSFPVGRVQFMYLKPLSFIEYLIARGKSDALEVLSSCSIQEPPPPAFHEEAIELVKEYFLVGGMPAAVATFCQNLSFLECARIHEILLATYRADFSKYATEAEQKYLRNLFTGIPQTLGQQFKYSKIDPHIRSRELKHALDQLEWAGLIHPIYASSASGVPLSVQVKPNRFKILFLDIGLAQCALQVDPSSFLKQDPFQINTGALAEQFVGQELQAYLDPNRQESLFFWQRERTGSDAEVDYLQVVHSQIIPVEVKAGAEGKLKSLYQFIEEKKAPFGIRISQHALSFDKDVLSVPFYLISQLPRLLASVPKGD